MVVADREGAVMAQEVRSILFTAEETRAAVMALLLQRFGALRPQQVERVELLLRDGSVHASIRLRTGFEARHELDAGELMGAILLYCRRARIPLPSRSQKRLGVVAGSLSLTTTLNFRRADPWVHGSTVVHCAAAAHVPD